MKPSTTPLKKRDKSKLAYNKVSEVMKQRQMCAQELADIIQSTPAHVSKIMSQQKPCLSLPLGLKISQALKTPIEKLFFL